jgi:hypothetical protein
MMAAMIEGLATEELDSRSVAVLSMVLGKLCRRYKVDPAVAIDVVKRSFDATAPRHDLARS